MRNAFIVTLLTCLLLLSGLWGLSRARANAADTTTTDTSVGAIANHSLASTRAMEADSPAVGPAVGLADLELLKVDAIDPVVVGAPITYTLTVSNLGPDEASSVVVTDTLPAGLLFISAMPSQGFCGSAGQDVSCSLGSIPNLASASIQIAALAATTGEMTNTAGVTAETSDPNLQNNTASAITTVTEPPKADLALTKVDAEDPVVIGSPITYTLTVSNLGPEDAAGVMVTDNLPSGLEFVSAIPSQGTCGHENQLVTCSLGSLSNGLSAAIELVASTLSTGVMSNNAFVISSIPDPNFSNNIALITTTVNPPYVPNADLVMSKAAAADPVVVGAPITYTLTVSNLGPDSALNVVVTDTLPSTPEVWLDFVSAVPSQGSCDFASQEVTCSLGTLAKDASATVEIIATAPADGQKINLAKVVSATVDLQPLNNLDSVTITVNPPPPPPPLLYFLPLIMK